MNKKIASDKRFYQQKCYIEIRTLYKEKKYKAVIKEATKYLEFYTDDVNIRFMRAKCYRNLEMFNETINDLKHNLNIDNDTHTLTELYYIYYYLNMYEEALELLPKIYETKCIAPYSASISELVMKKQLGLEVKVKKGARCDYIKEQILNYNPSLSLEHIKDHRIQTENNTAVFKENIDLNYLFDLIRNNIKNENKVNTEELLEIHYFPISNIGFNNTVLCNFIKVVVVPNTNNILTMYPIDNLDGNYVNDINIDYDKLFKRDNKVKTMSRIDKFNKKYNI